MKRLFVILIVLTILATCTVLPAIFVTPAAGIAGFFVGFVVVMALASLFHPPELKSNA